MINKYKEKIKWKFMDKEKKIRKIGVGNFMEKYEIEVIGDLIYSLVKNKRLPKYIHELEDYFSKHKFMDKLYVKAS